MGLVFRGFGRSRVWVYQGGGGVKGLSLFRAQAFWLRDEDLQGLGILVLLRFGVWGSGYRDAEMLRLLKEPDALSPNGIPIHR